MSRDRDQRDWERDREYGYSSNRNERRDRYDQDDNEKDIRRYSNRYTRNERRSRGQYNFTKNLIVLIASCSISKICIFKIPLIAL